MKQSNNIYIDWNIQCKTAVRSTLIIKRLVEAIYARTTTTAQLKRYEALQNTYFQHVVQYMFPMIS